MVPRKSTDEEVSFEWSHHRISSTNSKVRFMLHVSMTASGSEWVKTRTRLVVVSVVVVVVVFVFVVVFVVVVVV